MDALAVSSDALASMTLSIDAEVRMLSLGLTESGGIPYTGRIRHIGAVHFSPGMYVGVELTCANKSGHDGCVENVTYFTSKPRHGIFVRPVDVEVIGPPLAVAEAGALTFGALEGGHVRGSSGASGVGKRPLSGRSSVGLTGSMFARSMVQQRAAVAASTSSAAASSRPGGGSIPLELHAAEVAKYEAQIAELKSKLVRLGGVGEGGAAASPITTERPPSASGSSDAPLDPAELFVSATQSFDVPDAAPPAAAAAISVATTAFSPLSPRINSLRPLLAAPLSPASSSPLRAALLVSAGLGLRGAKKQHPASPSPSKRRPVPLPPPLPPPQPQQQQPLSSPQDPPPPPGASVVAAVRGARSAYTLWSGKKASAAAAAVVSLQVGGALPAPPPPSHAPRNAKQQQQQASRSSSGVTKGPSFSSKVPPPPRNPHSSAPGARGPSGAAQQQSTAASSSGSGMRAFVAAAAVKQGILQNELRGPLQAQSNATSTGTAGAASTPATTAFNSSTCAASATPTAAASAAAAPASLSAASSAPPLSPPKPSFPRSASKPSPLVKGVVEKAKKLGGAAVSSPSPRRSVSAAAAGAAAPALGAMRPTPSPPPTSPRFLRSVLKASSLEPSIGYLLFQRLEQRQLSISKSKQHPSSASSASASKPPAGGYAGRSAAAAAAAAAAASYSSLAGPYHHTRVLAASPTSAGPLQGAQDEEQGVLLFFSGSSESSTNSIRGSPKPTGGVGLVGSSASGWPTPTAAAPPLKESSVAKGDTDATIPAASAPISSASSTPAAPAADMLLALAFPGWDEEDAGAAAGVVAAGDAGNNAENGLKTDFSLSLLPQFSTTAAISTSATPQTLPGDEALEPLSLLSGAIPFLLDGEGEGAPPPSSAAADAAISSQQQQQLPLAQPAPPPPPPPTAFIRAYVGMCERGFNPDNPTKPCQDAILMEEHAASDGVVFAVFDGHGAAGHIVATLLRDMLPGALFSSPYFSQWVLCGEDTLPAPGTLEEAEEIARTAGSGGGGGVGRHNSQSQRPPPTKNEKKPPLALALALAPPLRRRNVAAALRDALAKAEAALLERRDIDCTLAGSTACIVVVTDGDHITVANVGDSRAMLLRRRRRRKLRQGEPAVQQQEEEEEGEGEGEGLVPLSLSVDHKPSLPSEGKRILVAGGSISPLTYEDGAEGPLRVWAPGVTPPGPGLAMSRSLGDTMGKKAGVSSEPDVYTGTLAPGEDAFIVVASDGLWEFIGGAGVVECLERARQRAEEEAREFTAAAVMGGAAAGLPPPRAQLQFALDDLIQTSIEKWMEMEGSFDDIGIVLAEIASSADAV